MHMRKKDSKDKQTNKQEEKRKIKKEKIKL